MKYRCDLCNKIVDSMDIIEERCTETHLYLGKGVYEEYTVEICPCCEKEATFSEVCEDDFYFYVYIEKENGDSQCVEPKLKIEEAIDLYYQLKKEGKNPFILQDNFSEVSENFFDEYIEEWGDIDL